MSPTSQIAVVTRARAVARTATGLPGRLEAVPTDVTVEDSVRAL